MGRTRYVPKLLEMVHGTLVFGDAAETTNPQGITDIGEHSRLTYLLRRIRQVEVGSGKTNLRAARARKGELMRKKVLLISK
jgi:hypothetical protein